MYLEGQRQITPKYPQDTRNAVVKALSSIMTYISALS